MKFEKLNDLIPYVVGGRSKVLSMHPYNAITLRMPGRHAKDTVPRGGDFVVCVDDEEMGWTEHQFTHSDIFMDLQKKKDSESEKKLPQQRSWRLMEEYMSVVQGYDPEKIDVELYEHLPGIHPKTFLYAVQCLAVAEHRRYAQHEKKFGGRYLPARFGAGIVEGRWTAAEAIDKQRRGRPGVEWLEKDHGLPETTFDLMNV